MDYQKVLADFAKRRQEIKALREKDPAKWTWRAIADKYGISQQRAQKIGASK
jgi:predicted acetyltransferase